MKLVKEGQQKFRFNPMRYTMEEVHHIRKKYGCDIVNELCFDISAKDIKKIKLVFDGDKYRVGVVTHEGDFLDVYID